jgi:hypothetical protein
MFTMDEFIIAVYCCVDDCLKTLTNGQSPRRRGFEPGLSDAGGVDDGNCGGISRD